jgi:glucokinase
MVSRADQSRARETAMSDPAERVLLADVGGTNARFAVLTDGAVGPIAHMAVADYARFDDALAEFMASRTDRGAIRSAVFGVAGVVEDGRCPLTNSKWVVDASELRARFGLMDIRIVNDFEAVAWSLPRLARGHLRQLGGGRAKLGAPMLVIGPGTGLGVAVYMPRAQDAFVAHSEGGHTTLPGGSLREDAIIETLRKRFGHVSAERALSGPGLKNLYQAIAALDAQTVPERSAEDITQAALADSCAVSRATLDTFCALLGEVAGNFALGFCAQGGVFIGGGIAPHMRDYLPRSPFRTRFESKGRMRHYVEPIPAFVILNEDVAFIGLRALATRDDPL